MGIGTKIKEALHGDKDTQSSPHDTTSANSFKSLPKAPGAFPSEDVPGHSNRTGGYISTNEPGLGKSSHNTYGRTDKPATSHGLGTHTTTTTGITTGNTSASRDHGLTGTSSSHRAGGDPYSATNTSNALNQADPRMGNTEGDYYSSGREGASGPHNSKMMNAADPRVDSDRDASRTMGNDYGSSGTHQTGKLTKENKSPYWGSTGSGRGTGTGMGTAGHDHDTRTAPEREYGVNDLSGQDQYGTHDGGITGGAGPREMNDAYDRQSYSPTGVTGNTAGVGGTHNLPHRPLDPSDPSNMSSRHEKINEYGAPTNSQDPGHSGVGKVATGAAAGYGAHELSNRHHKQDMRDYETAGGSSDRHGPFSENVRGTPTTGQQHQRGSTGGSIPDPYSKQQSELTGHGSSFGTSHGAHSSHNSGLGTNQGVYSQHDSPLGSHGMQPGPQSGLGPGQGIHSQHGSSAGGTGGVGQSMHSGHDYGLGPVAVGLGAAGAGQALHPSGHEFGRDSEFGRGTTGAGHTDGRDSGFDSVVPGRHLAGSMGSGSDYGGSNVASGGLGEDHYGPAHPGAKVYHSCDHCGKDNDISKYFRKEATYRLG
ncbi:uncharacterized protein BCR38DRAFT_412984 [Pseudomassariella vexata]|uniref:Cell surface protein n=1 Tax=Pseudomassariella vexata TaxID=1141098 RepID=A0A1Y2DJ75_9PEZI|nr:uncharacterized protein BCR38DRAFT_412984 [Pseudomassariella vexata]ORY59287.1 hypothetical protein BCR38DRAFT_412984 [Pseudomassariella vexata]